MILLDTHAWVWFTASPGELSKRARSAIEQEIDGGLLLVSAISVWEMALLVRRKRLVLSLPTEEWLAACRRVPFFSFVPVDADIAFRSVYLPGRLHDDPADRIIVATALARNVALVTKDLRLRRYRYVKTVW